MIAKIKNLDARKERYLRDSLQTRMGGLAANLARVKSFSDSDNNSAVVYLLLEESKYYIEWAGCEMDAETAASLVDLQRKISGWQLRWDSIWSDKDRRKMLAKIAARWSSEILRKSGLLDQ